MILIPGFAIREKLYESPSTLVYRARQEHPDRPAILKVLKGDFPRSEEVTRYRQEFEITNRLALEHVIRSFALQSLGKAPLIVLEDFGGTSIRQLMPGRPWSLAQILEIGVAIAAGIGQIHSAHIIHKDINPGNIVFDPSSGRLKIIDFGIATVLSRQEPSITSPSALEGTVAYVSPEQTGRMNRTLDYRTDFYSFGVTLHELLTGRLPFGGEDVLEVVHHHLTERPVPVDEIDPSIPHQVSLIVSKLLAKNAEDRYQSAWGIQADLEQCLRRLRAHGEIKPFALGAQDTPSRFTLPQKLYGREREIAELLDAFESVSRGARELMLVSGHSGIGKTSLVREIYKPVTKRQAYFISDKFDQLQKNVPFSGLVRALRDLVRQILTESEARLQNWRARLSAALGPNGRLILDLIPDAKLILGPQPPLSELAPREARNRFNRVFMSFVRVFCRPDHPLVIFLDDLQWADVATLELFEVLMTDDETRNLFLIGAYRDQEVGEVHPLSSTLERLKRQGARIRSICLGPLQSREIGELVADTLSCDPEDSRPLADLVQSKTAGNPFFVAQFLDTLYQRDLITFTARADSLDSDRPRWRWDMAEIEKTDITDNVVDLMIGRLKELPAPTREVVQLAACLGNQFDLYTLSVIHEDSLMNTQSALMAAIEEGLIVSTSRPEIAGGEAANGPLVFTRLAFLHDRVQQAAYALIPEDRKPGLHLRIGRLMLQAVPDPEHADALFQIVDHLNLGNRLIAGIEERIGLARLDLFAAKRAKLAAAFSAALRYLQAGMSAFGGDWADQHALTLELHRERAEAEYLNGNYDRSEELINEIWNKAHSDLDRAEAYALLITHYTVLGKNGPAIMAAAKALELLGMGFPAEEELEAAVTAELSEIERGLAKTSISSLIDLEPMTDPRIMVAMKVLMTVHTTVYFGGYYSLYTWVLARMTRLSMQYGNVPESSKGYASFGNAIAAGLGKYRDGYDFGITGLMLAEKYGNQSLKCKACLILSMFLSHWIRPIAESQRFDDEGQTAGMEAGELQFVGYILSHGRTVNRFHGGKNLGELLSDLKGYLAFTRRTKHNVPMDYILGAFLVISNLAGETASAESFDTSEITEARYLATCEESLSFAAICFYKTIKAFALYLFDQPQAALRWIEEAAGLIGYIKGMLTEAEHNFYHSLILTSLYLSAGEEKRPRYRAQIEVNQRQMQVWAESSPASFLHKHLLVEAELARVTGQPAQAMELYDRAIEAAGEAGLLQNEALANELAARFWSARGKGDFALLYARKAYLGFRAWGSSRKQAAVLSAHPEAGERASPSANTPLTQEIRIADLDLMSALKASQAISSEIVFDKLLDRLLRVAIENAGAENGSLIHKQSTGLGVVAASSGAGGRVSLIDATPVGAASGIAPTIVQSVSRTQRSVVLNNAALEGPFTADPHVEATQPKSILCMPVLYRGELTGILYFENNRVAGAFSPERIAVLELLAQQVAISLENASLYAERERAEEEVRGMNVLLEARVAERTAQLEAANKELEAFNSSVAHDLRAPLGSIYGFSRLLQEDYAGLLGGTGKEMLERIAGSAARMGRIIDDLMILSRLNKSDLNRGEIDLSGLARELVKELADREPSRHVEFAAAEGLKVNADPRLFRTALDNLLRNAWKYTARRPDASIELGSLDQEGRLIYFVKDNGVGFDMTRAGNLFQPFVRLHSSSEFEGTGIGLATVRRVFERHGGRIWAESTPERGATFFFSL